MTKRILHVLAVSVAAWLLMGHTVTAQDTGPLARITLPLRGQTLKAGVTILGSATSPQFSRYEVAYAFGTDANNWIVINGAIQPVDNGLLAVWNTRPLPDGVYALRLQVLNTDGTSIETIVSDLTLSNTAAGVNAADVTTSTAPITISGIITNDLTAVTGLDIGNQTIDLSGVPHAFVKGATYVLLAFVGLAVYLAVKRVLFAIGKRLFNRRVDYGR